MTDLTDNVDVDIEELGEVEELPAEADDVVEGDAKPAKKGKAKKAKADAEQIQFGAPWLAEHVAKACDVPMDAKGVRTILRTLIGAKKLDRGEGRYSFTGPDDPRVQVVVTFVLERKTAKVERAAAADKAKAEREANAAAGEAAEGDAPVEELEGLEDV
jgi:hypothetical protein